MRDLVIIGSSTVIPPSHHTPLLHHHHHLHTKATPKRTKPTISTSKPPPSSSPISTLHYASPLLSSVRWELTSRHNSSLKYYADLASKLAEDGRLEDFAMIVETLIVSGVEASKFVAALRLELVAKGLSRNLREGKIQSVVKVLKKSEKLGVSPLKLFDGFALKLLGKECRRMVDCGEVEELVDLMEILAGFHFSVKELVNPSVIVKSCVDKRNPNLAIRYACVLSHAHIVFCTIIHEFGRKGDLVSALAAYEASKQNLSHPNMYIYRTIIDVCGLCGDYMKSRYIYEDILHKKVTPNIYVFNSLMNVNAHDLSYTFHVYKNMQNLGVTADLASYNILLKACCLARRVDLAQDIYGEVKHLESTGVLKLDVFTYSTIIKVFADAKLWQMALKIKEDMLLAGVTPNTVTWSSLISACANTGLLEQAIQLFEEMLLTGCEPNAQCCNILLHACVEACQYDRAFRLFQSWKANKVLNTFGDDYGSNADSILSTERAHRHCITSAEKRVSNSHHLNFVKKFPFTPTTATYNILMKACANDYYRAKALMDEMKTVGLSPNHISWSILIDICGNSGNVEGALQILKTMCMAGIKPDVVAYTTAMKACVGGKNLKLAFSLFAEMKRYQIQPNLVTYNTLLRARSRYGSLHEVQQCLAIYQDMRRAGYKSNDYYLKELIEEWCEGVIQDNNWNEGEVSSSKRTNLEGPQSLLLEKVAAHLQKSIAESLAIDLQGLTKVEARIVVLAVLRMIKENYTQGYSVRDDMSINLGVSKVDADPAKPDSEVRDTIVKLLRNELGLEVLLVEPRNTLDKKSDLESPIDTDQKSEEILASSGFSTKLKYSARRPAVLQRLKVTRNSLRHWLRRRVATRFN